MRSWQGNSSWNISLQVGVLSWELSFYVSFVVSLDTLLNTLSNCKWFDMPWRWCDGMRPIPEYILIFHQCVLCYSPRSNFTKKWSWTRMSMLSFNGSFNQCHEQQRHAKKYIVRLKFELRRKYQPTISGSMLTIWVCCKSRSQGLFPIVKSSRPREIVSVYSTQSGRRSITSVCLLMIVALNIRNHH